MDGVAVVGRFGVAWASRKPVSTIRKRRRSSTRAPGSRRPSPPSGRFGCARFSCRSAVGRAICGLRHLVARGLAVVGRLRQVDRRIGVGLDYLFHREIGQLGVSRAGAGEGRRLSSTTVFMGQPRGYRVTLLRFRWFGDEPGSAPAGTGEGQDGTVSRWFTRGLAPRVRVAFEFGGWLSSPPAG